MIATAGARRFAIPVTRVAPRWRRTATGLVTSAIRLAAQRYTVTTGEARWLVVARHSAVTIVIDTSPIEHEYGHTFRIWYWTDHAVMRYYEGKAFDRETVQTVRRCDGIHFAS